MQWGRVYRELRRRHVFRVGAAYLVSAWLLLQLGAILIPAFAMPHWVLRVLFGVLALGFPVALALAWAFEVTSKGVRRTEEVDSEEARSPEGYRRAGRILNAGIIVVLAAAVGVLAWRLYLRPGASSAPAAMSANSIAVLPFVDLSPRHNEAYFAEGVAEQLLDTLAQATNLKVVARTSAFQFEGKAEDVRKIGKALDVANVLEGSVLRDGDQVRISVQLVNTRTGFQEWSHTYQRTMGNIFKVQDEITRAIGHALQAKFGPAGGSAAVAVAKADPPANPQAYDEYLLGRHLMNERTQKSFKEALTHFKRAVKLDPNYAAPYAQIAITYLMSATAAGREHGVELAKPYLDRAVVLAPDAPDTQAAQGLYLGFTSTDWKTQFRYFDEAVRANPSYMDAVNWKANALWHLGRYREAWETLSAGAQRDPLNWPVNGYYLGGLLGRRRFGQAREVAERFLTVNAAQGNDMLGDVELAQGHYAAATRRYLRALAARPDMRDAAGSLGTILVEAGLNEEFYRLGIGQHGGIAAAIAGHREVALERARANLAKYGDKAMPNQIAALVHLYLGEKDAARERFARAWTLVRNQDDGNPFSAFNFRNIVWYAALLRDAGKRTEAKKLIGELRAEAEKRHRQQVAAGIPPDGTYEFRIAEVDFLGGKHDAGLAALAQAAVRLGPGGIPGVAGGLLLTLNRMPQFDAVRDDPRFQAIVRRAQDREARIRAQILPVLCDWTYPKTGWHPAAATCAGVAKTKSAAAAST